jgi:uncharacterized protein RhaS with RHS repeats
MRIYDPRVGRFLSVDPIGSSYPELTPYQFAGNSPILNIDMDGLEPLSQGMRVYLARSIIFFASQDNFYKFNIY